MSSGVLHDRSHATSQGDTRRDDARPGRVVKAFLICRLVWEWYHVISILIPISLWRVWKEGGVAARHVSANAATKMGSFFRYGLSSRGMVVEPERREESDEVWGSKTSRRAKGRREVGGKLCQVRLSPANHDASGGSVPLRMWWWQ